jgi:hypothetical protein
MRANVYNRLAEPQGPERAEASWRLSSRYRKSDTGRPCAEH